MLPDYKIIQIIPATGWHAIYSDDNGKPDPENRSPVVCFALIEYEDNGKPVREVRAMTNTDIGIAVEDASNFACLAQEAEIQTATHCS